MKTASAAALCLLAMSCAAFAGAEKNAKDLFNEAKNSFSGKFKFLLLDSEKKELKCAKTAEAVTELEARFWKVRDPSPDTEKNEFKEEITQRLADIAEAKSTDDAGRPNTSFAVNAGLNGEMAQVYILHGKPDFSRFLRGQSFVDLLLWTYYDKNGLDKYRFLFYRKKNLGYFRLFRDQYFLSRYVVLNELASPNYFSPGTFSAESIIRDIWTAGGDSFLNALTAFSDDSRITLSDGLKPPTPEEIRLAYSDGGAPTGGEEKPQPNLSEKPVIPQTQPDGNAAPSGNSYVRHSVCDVSIPGKLTINPAEILFLAEARNLDWQVDGEIAKCVLAYRLVLQNKRTGETQVISGETVTLAVIADLEGGGKGVSVRLKVEGATYSLDSGHYVIYLYLQNKLTGKYEAYLEE